MYTILPDGTVVSVGRDDGEEKHLSLTEIASQLREAYNAEKE